MKNIALNICVLCLLPIAATAQGADPAKAAAVAYDYIHNPVRDQEINWLREGAIRTPSDPNQAELDKVLARLTDDFEKLLREQREFTKALEDEDFFDLLQLTSKDIVASRLEHLSGYIGVVQRNTLDSWRIRVSELLSASSASDESQQRFRTNFMAGMEDSFNRRLQAMGYTDRANFIEDMEASERSLVRWQEIFKLLHDTYGRWQINTEKKQIVFKSEIEQAQFDNLTSHIGSRR